jgi:hypothetical protein
MTRIFSISTNYWWVSFYQLNKVSINVFKYDLHNNKGLDPVLVHLFTNFPLTYSLLKRLASIYGFCL